MPKHYYQLLIVAFFACLIVPASYFLYLSQQTTQEESVFTDTRYQFITVNHPIQPIPTQLEIDKDWVIVGKALFHSPLLSKDNSVSCASCHQVDYGGDDGFSVSTGVDSHQGLRNSPTVLNAVFNFRQFWDGSVSTLAEQVNGPIHNPVEMGTNWSQVLIKINADSYFSEAFLQLGITDINANDIVKAITVYEESLITPNAPIDRYLLGNETALNARQIRGLDKFVSFGCVTCHQGRNIGGNIFQRLGRIDETPITLQDDLGRYIVTKQEYDKFVFKVPSLRNIADTAPYFHNGSVNSLEEAVMIMAEVQLGRKLSQDDVTDLVALLQGFSAPTLDLLKHANQ
ncbi:MAG: cytochrome-c peroxidase [Thalassotalea sp.]|nr:cytochrome-c peroxidase [Thalassotalea sp.]